MTDSIKIDCPNCHAKYKIPPNKFVPKTRVKLNCKSCGTAFKFVVPGSVEIKPKEDIGAANNFPDENVGDKTIIGGPQTMPGGSNVDPESVLKDCKIILTYTFEGKEIKRVLNKRVTVIGRTEGDLIINDSLISRKHFSIEVKSPTMIELKDLASTNGTFHNGMKITSIFLQSGDNIKVGSTTIHFNSEIQFL